MFKQVVDHVLAAPQRQFEKIWGEMNCKEPPMFFLDTSYRLTDRFLQMCIPSVEYPRSDAPDSIRFAGGLPKGHRDLFSNPPSWWSDITNNKTKKIVGVSQGSIAMDFTDLVIPTMTGLANRDDILVVVALGRKGAALPEGTPIPANARVADFLPFDELMPHCSAFISNGGYGTFQHTIDHGIPIIVGGATEDKPEVAGRAEWSGMGINLHTGTPTPELILSSVSEIISNPSYKKRALELEKEMASFDPISVVAQTIDELAAGKA
jgi:UDP:flavonoid glycosyltransferase YjiC (YdhE family)